MGNSSITLQELADDARTFGELAPSLPTGGYSDSPALSIGNDTMQAMIAGGPAAEPFNFKWNRSTDNVDFFINSWQQDYFIPGLVSCGWLESCTAVCYSTTQYPKPVYPVECKRDLLISETQNATLAKICWMTNKTMITGVWGQSTQASVTGLVNPGPGVVYTSPANQTAMPINPITQVKDAFGNLWVVTGYGTCGGTNPFITNLNPTFPTLQSPATVSTTATDGSVTWTAVNPNGQGFRISPIPGQTGPVYLIQPVVQNRVARLTSLSQFLDPIPDDYYSLFKQGFFAQCYRRSPLKEVRGKFEQEQMLWNRALTNAVNQGSRELDDWGFYPGAQIMESGYSVNAISPALPYGPWSN